MKYLLIIILFFSQISYSQNKDSIQSREIEISAWESYFAGNKKEAIDQFKKAIQLDSTNILAKIGLFNSKTEDELTQSDFELVDNLPEGPTEQFNYSDIMFALMMTNQVDKELPESLIQMRNKYDENYIEFKAQLTNSSFEVYNDEGDVIKSGQYKERKPAGIWKKYGYQNKLHHSFSFQTESDTVVIKYYKPDGDVTREEWITGIPFTNNSNKIKEVVYWQETPGKNIDYLFVSKEGFKIYDKEKLVIFDESTPDNIIQLKFNPETHMQEAYIWKNGKKEPFDYCPYDGTTVTYMENGEKKSYRWQDCEKIMIEN